ncbi:hypothetical protein [Mucilaginibacter antarcticus]
MEAVVTSLSIPSRTNADASTIQGVLVSINGQAYIVQFDPGDIQQLQSLRVNDKIIIKSSSAQYLRNYLHLVLSANYVERNHKVIVKRDFSKVGC